MLLEPAFQDQHVVPKLTFSKRARYQVLIGIHPEIEDMEQTKTLRARHVEGRKPIVLRTVLMNSSLKPACQGPVSLTIDNNYHNIICIQVYVYSSSCVSAVTKFSTLVYSTSHQ